MSEAPEFNTGSSTLQRLMSRMSHLAAQKSLHESLPEGKKWLDEQVRCGQMTADFAAEVLAMMERSCSPPPTPTASEVEVMEFIERLKNRQGTTISDFNLLYRRKADLDANDETHDTRP